MRSLYVHKIWPINIWGLEGFFRQKVVCLFDVLLNPQLNFHLWSWDSYDRMTFKKLIYPIGKKYFFISIKMKLYHKLLPAVKYFLVTSYEFLPLISIQQPQWLQDTYFQMVRSADFRFKLWKQ